MNAATSTVASAGIRRPRKNAVSVAATTNTIQGPTRISSWMMSWRRASTSEFRRVRDVVRRAALAVRAVAADLDRNPGQPDPERVAPDVLAVLVDDAAAQPLGEVVHRQGTALLLVIFDQARDADDLVLRGVAARRIEECRADRAEALEHGYGLRADLRADARDRPDEREQDDGDENFFHGFLSIVRTRRASSRAITLSIRGAFPHAARPAQIARKIACGRDNGLVAICRVQSPGYVLRRRKRQEWRGTKPVATTELPCRPEQWQHEPWPAERKTRQTSEQPIVLRAVDSRSWSHPFLRTVGRQDSGARAVL